MNRRIVLLLTLLFLTGCGFDRLCLKHGDIIVYNTYGNTTVVGDKNMTVGTYQLNLFGCDQVGINITAEKPILEQLGELYLKNDNK